MAQISSNSSPACASPLGEPPYALCNGLITELTGCNCLWFSPPDCFAKLGTHYHPAKPSYFAIRNAGLCLDCHHFEVELRIAIQEKTIAKLPQDQALKLFCANGELQALRKELATSEQTRSGLKAQGYRKMEEGEVEWEDVTWFDAAGKTEGTGKRHRARGIEDGFRDGSQPMSQGRGMGTQTGTGSGATTQARRPLGRLRRQRAE